MAVGIIVLIVVLALLLAMAVASVVIVMRVDPTTDTSEGGTCGQCGYGVRGIDSLTCPECGADLREVGIVGRQRSLTGRFVLASVMWLIAMSVMGMAAGMVLLAMIGLSPNGMKRASATWAVLCVMLMVALACVVGVVWMNRRTRASGAALAGVLLIWGFCMTALLLLVGALRF